MGGQWCIDGTWQERVVPLLQLSNGDFRWLAVTPKLTRAGSNKALRRRCMPQSVRIPQYARRTNSLLEVGGFSGSHTYAGIASSRGRSLRRRSWHRWPVDCEACRQERTIRRQDSIGGQAMRILHSKSADSSAYHKPDEVLSVGVGCSDSDLTHTSASVPMCLTDNGTWTSSYLHGESRIYVSKPVKYGTNKRF